MEKKYVIKNFEDGTYLQQDREGWGEDFTMCEFDSLELAVDMVALQPYGNFTIEIIYKKLKIMEKRNISIYWLIDKMITKKHTDSELNDIFNQAKAMHKEDVKESYREGRTDQQSASDSFYNRNAESYYNEKFGGE